MKKTYIAFVLALITALTTITASNLERVNAAVDGWSKQDGNWYYYNNHNLKTGWLNYGGVWYYLNPSSGAMQKGWISDNGKWYYLDESGVMRTGKIEDNGTQYVLGSDGVMNEDLQPPSINVEHRTMSMWQTNKDDSKPTWILKWDKATDVKTTQNKLTYYVYQAVGKYYETIGEWETKATLLNKGGTKDIDEYPLKLETKQDYYYVVIVENEAGIKNSYKIEHMPSEYIR